MADHGSRRAAIVITAVAVVCVSLGLIIGLVLHLHLHRQGEPQPVRRSSAVGDCISEGSRAGVDRETCLQRRYASYVSYAVLTYNQ